jgi:inner membrane protein
VTLKPESRKRGLFQVIVYLAKVKLKGNFKLESHWKQQHDGWAPNWQKAYVALNVRDVKGLTDGLKLSWAGKPVTLLPGTKGTGLIPTGTHAALSGLQEGGSYPYEVEMELKGSEALQLLAAGKSSQITMQGAWPHPSFQGGYLPTTRQVDANGFKATWNLSYFSREIEQSWLDSDSSKNLQESNGANYEGFYRGQFVSSESVYGDYLANKSPLGQSLVGASLMEPVDFYKHTRRAIDYGVLFMALTLGTLLILEFTLKVRLHLLQYGLTGLAMCLFYLLLLSLCEHIGFDGAYLLSSLTIAGLIGWYVYGAVAESSKKKKATGITVSVLGLLYAYLYTTLNQEDYALLIGTLGLLVALVVVMQVTKSLSHGESHGESSDGEGLRQIRGQES